MASTALALLAFATQGKGGAPAPQSLPLHGFLLASTDASVVARAKREPSIDRDYSIEDLTRRFATPRFEIRAWGADYALVVDTESGPFQNLHDRTLVLREMAAHVGPSRLIRTADLSDEAAQALANLMGSLPIDPKSGQKTLPPSLGVKIMTVAVSTRGDSVRKVTRMEDDEESRRGEKSLFAARHDETAGLVPASASRPVLPHPPTDSLTLTAVGYGHDLTTGAEQMLPFVHDVRDRLRQRQAEATSAFTSRLSLSEDARVTGSLSQSQAPKEVWNDFADQFALGWKGEGFGSASEARAFFDGSTVSFTTQIGIMQVFDSGGSSDPDRPGFPLPGAAGIDVILSAPGRYAP